MGKRKFKKEDRVIGNSKKGAFWDRRGRILSYIGDSQYQVLFNDSKTETVYSWWINPLENSKNE